MSQSQLYDALLDALYATFGNHPGFRIAHAKGVLVGGTFVASQAAQGLSRAAHFQGEGVPVLVRFSNFSGVPSTRDGDPSASPHGMAIRFELPGGQSTDIVAHSFDGFPVATPQAFLAFCRGLLPASHRLPIRRRYRRSWQITPGRRHSLKRLSRLLAVTLRSSILGSIAWCLLMPKAGAILVVIASSRRSGSRCSVMSNWLRCLMIICNRQWLGAWVSGL